MWSRLHLSLSHVGNTDLRFITTFIHNHNYMECLCMDIKYFAQTMQLENLNSVYLAWLVLGKWKSSSMQMQ